MLKSTQIVIEQLFIGLFFFLIIGIFVLGRKILPAQWPASLPDSWALGAVLFIAAYAAGVVIDRWADTLLDRLFCRIRLKTIIKRLTISELEQHAWEGCDPYPEACLRMEIYDREGGIAEYHAYLRTRIRITRAMTCLLPAFFISLQTAYYNLCRQQRYSIGLLILLIYAALIIAAIATDKIKSPPKSFEVKKFRNYVLDLKNRKPGINDEVNKIFLKFKAFDWICPAGIGILIFTTVSFVLGCKHNWTNQAGIQQLVAFPLVLLMITLLVGRSWWRISETFFNLISDFHSNGFSKDCRWVAALSRFKQKQ